MTQLIKAVKARDSDLVKQLLYSSIDINAQDKYGSTALHVAVRMELDDIVSILLEHPDIDVNSKEPNGNTPLLVALSEDDYFSQRQNIVKQLIANPSVNVNAVNHYGKTALYLVCSSINLDYLSVILKRDDLNMHHISSDKDTVLHVAYDGETYCNGFGLDDCDDSPFAEAKRQRQIKIQVIETLLAINPDLINIKNRFGKTILHCCAKHGEWELASVLLRYPNLDVNSQDLNGKTPLHYAYERNMKKTIGILLDHPDINTVSEDEDNKGKKIIDYFRPEPEPEPQFDLEPPLRTPSFFKPAVVEKSTPEQVDPKSWCYFL